MAKARYPLAGYQSSPLLAAPVILQGGHMDPLSAFRLEGRSAAITGGASGIGRATAEVLAGAGASVVVGDLDEAGAEAVAKGINQSGGRAVAQKIDISKRADLDAMVDRAVSEFGRLDVM